MTSMNELAVIEKYTGRTADSAKIAEHPMGAFLLTLADRLRQTESELRREITRIRESADKVMASLDAGPGDMVYPVNPSGEFRTNPDALIAVRATYIEQIRALAAHVGLVRK